MAPDGVHLQWLNFANSRFTVEWSPSLNPPSWRSFTNTVLATNGAFTFLDDGSQSDGLNIARFYRVRLLP